MVETNEKLKIMKSRLEVLFVPEKDRYTIINIDGATVSFDVLTEMPRQCKVGLHGCESPIYFQLKVHSINKMRGSMGSIVEYEQRPDLTCYLSTEVREPSSNSCERMVDKLRKFRFYAPGN